LEACEISVVIPAYNEEERIARSMKETSEYLKKSFKTWEIIVVDDGSHDKTQAIFQSIMAHIPSVHFIRFKTNRGKGHAVREGVKAAQGQLLLVMDADLATPLEETKPLCSALKEGFDIAIGSRLGDSQKKVEQSFSRRLSGRFFNILVRLLIMNDFSDTQCGFKLFKSKAAKSLFNENRLDGYSFDIEVLYLAKKRGYKIKEVPIQWTAQEGSKVRVLRDAFRMVADIFTIRRLHG
jgi:dolichyl-phosphate beta-glucosyltransferase